MRYVRQSDPFSCGPVAIVNALKWAGVQFSGEHVLPMLRFACRTIDPESPDNFELNGTTDADFARVLRYAGKTHYTARKRKRPSVPEMARHLKAGGAIALSYWWEEEAQCGFHFCLLTGYRGGRFECVNDQDAPNVRTVSFRSSATVKTWLKRRMEAPTAWFLTKKD